MCAQTVQHQVTSYIIWKLILNYSYYPGQAFCSAHSDLIGAMGYPTGLRPFLTSCSTRDTPVDPNNYTKNMKAKVEEVLREISKKSGKPPPDVKSATDVQGLLIFIKCVYQ